LREVHRTCAALRTSALYHLGHGRFFEAARHAENLCRLCPSHSAQQLRAACYLLAGQWEEAVLAAGLTWSPRHRQMPVEDSQNSQSRSGSDGRPSHPPHHSSSSPRLGRTL
jgi:hypothetical protein